MSKLSDLQDAHLIGRLNADDWKTAVSPWEMPSVREWLQFAARVESVKIFSRVQKLLVEHGLISDHGFVQGVNYFSNHH